MAKSRSLRKHTPHKQAPPGPTTRPQPVTALKGRHGSTADMVAQARQVTEQHSEDGEAWGRYGMLLARDGQLQPAREALERALSFQPLQVDAKAWLAVVCYHLNAAEAAQLHVHGVLDQAPEQPQACWIQALLDRDAGRHQQALAGLERARVGAPDDPRIHESQANLLHLLNRFDEAIAAFHALSEKSPNNYTYWNSLGNLYRDLADLPQAETAYRRAMELAGNKNAIPYSNLVTLGHYDPAKGRSELYRLSSEWQARFAPSNPPARPSPDDRDPRRRLRVGLFSDGFRSHPVGNMIVAALEQLDPAEVELFLYPTHTEYDQITERLRRIADHWTVIKYLDDQAFRQQLLDDGIDILFDLAGHNNGTRARTVALHPAPLVVKWVGGLINTTGVQAIDYLLSDTIETPPGAEEDAFYGERLIRLPDDYIVYSPPPYAPKVGPLPALNNGYVTLGCFNNPTKLNPTLLHEWAQLLHALPDARLLLKGRSFREEHLCTRIFGQFKAEGIASERILLEGPDDHRRLLGAYNRVDIALDTWPYSGGLTTCEALHMGVPVVTLPGPTFAGRHSATHLVNAGLPELVLDSWDAYRARVIELAADRDSLSQIRAQLRTVLALSPASDGRRFARHLMRALRAIWQRDCEDKPPAPLHFNADGLCRFDDEDDNAWRDLGVHDKPPMTAGGFVWPLSTATPLIAIDNRAGLFTDSARDRQLLSSPVHVIAFDPARRLTEPGRHQAREDRALYLDALLGDGQPATLHHCLDPNLSATLVPRPDDQLPAFLHKPLTVITRHPVPTLALDQISGLDRLDWLRLDAYSDPLRILAHSAERLRQTLLLEIEILFQPTHQGQIDLGAASQAAAKHGFRFYRLHQQTHRSHFPPGRSDLDSLKQQSSELLSAEALFIPDAQRWAALSDEQRIALAFLLHSFYQIRDLSHELLAQVDAEQAEAYLLAEQSLRAMNAQQRSKGTSADGILAADVEDVVQLKNVFAEIIGEDDNLPALIFANC